MKKTLSLLLSTLLILNTVFMYPIRAIEGETVTEEPATQEVAEEPQEEVEEVPEVEETIPEVEETISEVKEETKLGDEGPLTYHDGDVPYRVEVYLQERNFDDYGNESFSYVLSESYSYRNVASDGWIYAYKAAPDIAGYHIVNNYIDDGIVGINYIETDGTQYINTGVYPDEKTTVQSRFQLVNESKDYQTLFGVTDPDDALFNFTFGARHDDSNHSKLEYKYGIGRNAVNEQIERFADNDIHDVYLDAYGMRLDGLFYEPIDFDGEPDFDFMTDGVDEGELYLFANNVDGAAKNKGSYRLYHTTIYDGEDLVREYYPAVTTDWGTDQYGDEIPPFTVGLYDFVTETFFVPESGNDFESDYYPFTYIEDGPYSSDNEIIMRLYYDLDNVVVWYHLDDDEDSTAYRTYYAGDTLDLMPEELEEKAVNDRLHNVGRTLLGWNCDALSHEFKLSDEYIIDSDFIDSATYYKPLEGPAYYYNKGISFYGYWQPNNSLITIDYDCMSYLVPEYPLEYTDNDSDYYYATKEGNYYFGGIFTKYDSPRTYRIHYPIEGEKPGYYFAGWDIYGIEPNTWAYYDVNGDDIGVQNLVDYNIDNAYGEFDEDGVYHTYVNYESTVNGYDDFVNLNPLMLGKVKFVARWVPTGEPIDYKVNIFREYVPDFDDPDLIDLYVGETPYILVDDEDLQASADSFVAVPQATIEAAEDYVESNLSFNVYESVDSNFIDVDGDFNEDIRKVESITSYPTFFDSYDDDPFNFSLGISGEGHSINTGLKTNDVYKVDMDIQTIGDDILYDNPYLIFGDNGTFKNIDAVIKELTDIISNIDFENLSEVDPEELEEQLSSILNIDLTKLNYVNSGFTFLSGSLGAFDSPIKTNIFGCGNLSIFNSSLIKPKYDEGPFSYGFNPMEPYNVVAERNNDTAELYINDKQVAKHTINNIGANGEFFLFGMDNCINTKEIVHKILEIIVKEYAKEIGIPFTPELVDEFIEMIIGSSGLPVYLESMLSTIVNNIGLYGYYSLYGAKIYNEENELIRNYVPCVTVENLDAEFVSEGRNVKPGTYGLYDEVEGIFYPCVNEELNFQAGLLTYNDGYYYDSDVYSGTAGYVNPYGETELNIFLKRREATVNVLEFSEIEDMKYSNLGPDYLELHNETIYDGDTTSIFEDEDYDHDLYYYAFDRLYRKLDSKTIKWGDYIEEPEVDVKTNYMFGGWEVLFGEFAQYYNQGFMPIQWDDNSEDNEIIIFQDIAPLTLAPKPELLIDENNVIEVTRSESGGGISSLLMPVYTYYVKPGTQISFKTIPDADIMYYSDNMNGPMMNLFTDPITIDEDCMLGAVVLKDGTIPQSLISAIGSFSTNGPTMFDARYEFIVESDEQTFEDYKYVTKFSHGIPDGIWVGGVDYKTGILNRQDRDSRITYDPKVKAYEPELRVYYHTTLLTEGVDYTVKYKNNKSASTSREKLAVATITGKGSYKGTYEEINFAIEPLNLRTKFESVQDNGAFTETLRVTAIIPEISETVFKYNGKVQKPKIKSLTIELMRMDPEKLVGGSLVEKEKLQTIETYKLKEGKDFEVVYQNSSSTDPGDYGWGIIGIGNYTGEIKFDSPYTITEDKLIKSLKISGVKDVDFFDVEGWNFSFGENLVVKDGKNILTEGVDYSLMYYYSSSNPYRIDTFKTASTGDKEFFKGSIPSDALRADSYNVVIRGIEGSGYSGYVIKSFKIKGIDMSKVKYSKLDSSYPYASGSEVTPLQSLTYKNMPLKEYDPYVSNGEYEYVAEYENNINPGTATITYIGNPYRGFTGTKTVKFKIKGASLSTYKSTEYEKAKDIYYVANESVEFINSVEDREDGVVNPYYNYVISPYYTNKVSGVTQSLYLEPKNHYTIEYVNNDKVGTAKVIYTGVNAYYGSTLTKSFKINSYPIDSDPYKLITIEGLNEVQEYSKGGATVNIKIYQGNYKLKEGVDYKLTYKKNDVVSPLDRSGNPDPVSCVTIKGIGNYTGTISNIKFTITNKDISKTTIVAEDVVPNYNNGDVCDTKVTITDTNGKALKANTDFDSRLMYYYAADTLVEVDGAKVVRKTGDEVGRFDIVFPGTTIRVVAKGIGNYKGSVATTYRVGAYNLADAKVTVRKQYYTGSNIYVNREDITVVVDGNELLPYEYDIVGYTNNTKVGKSATITIRGKGEFVGETTAKFSIVARPIDSYIIRFYGREPEEFYDIEKYEGWNSLVTGTMDDVVVKINKDKLTLTKNKYKYTDDCDFNDEYEDFDGWYCSEIHEFIEDGETIRNKEQYAIKCDGSVLHFYAVWFDDYESASRR